MPKKLIKAFFLISIILITLLSIGHSKQLSNKISKEIDNLFSHSLASSIKFEIDAISAITGTISLLNVSVAPKDETERWVWNCKNLLIHVNPLMFIFNKKFGLSFSIHNMNVETAIEDNNPTIKKYLNRVFASTKSELPFLFKTCQITDSKFYIYDAKNDFKLNGEFKLKIESFKDKLQIQNFIKNTDFFYKNDKIFSNIHGEFEIDYGSIFNSSILLFAISKYENISEIKFTGNFDESSLIGHVCESKNKFFINPFFLKKIGENWIIDFDMCICLKDLYSIYQKIDISNEDIDGICRIYAKGNLSKDICATVSIENPRYKKIKADRIIINLTKKNKNIINGNLNLTIFSKPIHAIWSYEIEKEKIKIIIDGPFNFPIKIGNNEFEIDNLISSIYKNENNLIVNGIININENKKNKIKLQLSSIIDLENKNAKLKIKKDNILLDSLITSFDPIEIKNLIVKNNQKEHCNLNIKDESLDLKISYEAIKTLIKSFFDYDLSVGQGIIKFNGNVKDSNFYTGRVSIENGIIQIPNMNNFIKDINCYVSYNNKNRLLLIENALIDLYKGKIKTDKILVDFDKNWNIKTLNVPIKLSECFIQKEGDLFGFISGNFLIKEDNNKQIVCRSIDGNLILNQAHFHKNLFSFIGTGMSGFLFASLILKTKNTKLNINVKTKTPVEVFTSSIDANANFNLNISGTPIAPEVEGKVTIENGKISFAYKDLKISKGSLTFSKQNPHDPFVKLIAQDRVKKYLITMTAQGPISSPEIHFSSIPTLTEEQIISLLFAGSIEESLNMIVPTFMFSNIESLLFGSAKNTNQTLKKFLSPLKKIRIVPSFADQTGRGSIRLAIEIEASDRLRACIRNNANLSEDTRFEVEYLISDEVSIKGIKDERGDISGEVEMRYKF